MEKSEFIMESSKLKEIIQKLNKEDEELIIRQKSSMENYDKSDFVRAHLLYLIEKRLQDIKLIKNKPYFARLDFREKTSNITEKLYIGKLSILDYDTKKPLIVDWRAPIANLYYEGRIGNASYYCQDGEISGEISLKRQFFIESGDLKKYVDVDITTNDALLQEALGKNADDRLKNIVATIQEEQNKIIRAPMGTPLIVQGVAGSGKTTIALHRIAYLVYQYDEKFKPEEFMIIAPNKFFLNYISNVLPDLGVENVLQYTFEDFAYELIGKRLKISDGNEKLVTIVNQEFDDINKGNVDLIINEAKFKSSIEFKDLVDAYLVQIEENYIPKKDFQVEGVKITSYTQMQLLFLDTYSLYPFEKRVQELKKHVVTDLKERGPYIIEKIKEKRLQRIERLKELNLSEEEFLQNRIEIFEEYEGTIKKLEEKPQKIVDEWFKTISKKEAIEYYKNFLENYISISAVHKNSEMIEYLIKNTLKNLNKKEISFEDLAPIMYIHYKLYGAKYKNDLRHIIIDEAQDYGEFQFWTLKTILNSNSLTILGDIAQGVHGYRGINNWKDFIHTEFGFDTEVTYTTLKKTYRTTTEIMNLANNVISKLPEYEKEFIVLGEPVINAKDCISINRKENSQEVVLDIHKKIDLYQKSGLKSIAIIGKTKSECEEIYKQMTLYRKNVKLIQSKDSEYNAGISIVPSYLAKGLEFDAVFLFNVNDANYSLSNLDIKLLYVAITRAMSKLDIYYQGRISDLIN